MRENLPFNTGLAGGVSGETRGKARLSYLAPRVLCFLTENALTLECYCLKFANR
jgi:hypothetical protein